MSLGKQQELEQVILSTFLEAVQLHFLQRAMVLHGNVEVGH
jgi:hypothetical protein